MPERLQRSRAKGWRKPEGAVIVTRPGRWSNPFRVGDLVSDAQPYAPFHPYDGSLPAGVYPVRGNPGRVLTVRRVEDRADAVGLFREYIEYHDDVFPLERIRRELGGRDLLCWCPLDGLPCHADVLLELATPAWLGEAA